MSKRSAAARPAPAAEALDAFDRRILALYQHDTRIVAEEIGEKVGLSAASVQRRLKRLRETGVILRETACLNRSALGFPVACVVGVDVEYERAEHLDSFKKLMLKHRNVQQCYYVTGEIDFILVVATRDLAEYEAFTREVFMNNRNVRSFTTYVVMDAVKVGGALPL
jgi:Lrp/AsnC family transcriptional regulator, leucine-responsive regulatory protein